MMPPMVPTEVENHFPNYKFATIENGTDEYTKHKVLVVIEYEPTRITSFETTSQLLYDARMVSPLQNQLIQWLIHKVEVTVKQDEKRIVII